MSDSDGLSGHTCKFCQPTDLVARLRVNYLDNYLNALCKEAADALEAAEARRISAEDRLTNALAGEQQLRLAAEARAEKLYALLRDVYGYEEFIL